MGRLYIFDFDGTLVNTMELWDKITVRFLAGYGIEIDDATFKFFSTQNFNQVLSYMLTELKLPESAQSLKAKWYGLALSIFKAEARALPGAVECLERLRSEGAKLALFTLSPRTLVDMLLTLLGLSDMLDRTFMGGETKEPKTEPSSWLEIARAMDATAAETTVVEDSAYACRAAKLAGMTTCGVLIDNKNPDELIEICDFVISDYSQLK